MPRERQTLTSRQRRAFLAAAAYALAFAFAFAPCSFADNYIPVPTAPTYADYGHMSDAHLMRSNTLYRQWTACTRRGIHFGYCSNGCSQQETPYRQCCSLDAQMCAENRAFMQAYGICLERAESNPDTRNDDRVEALTKLLTNVNAAWDRAETARSGIENPVEFFGSALGRSTPLYKELFDDSDHLKNTGLAEQLYKFAFTQGRAGIVAQEGTANPVALAVQRSSLDAISKYYGRAFDALNVSITQLIALDVRLKQHLETFNPESIHLDSHESKNNDISECAVLKNPAASRHLLEEHSDLWLAITARCTK